MYKAHSQCHLHLPGAGPHSVTVAQRREEARRLEEPLLALVPEAAGGAGGGRYVRVHHGVEDAEGCHQKHCG
ncbi:Uncharacterised protein [Mycobacteroides abscessus subsp. massiliense]|nr:Uncharacterised protein [Mycobacteroides abscessus subsp. massiliense]